MPSTALAPTTSLDSKFSNLLSSPSFGNHLTARTQSQNITSNSSTLNSLKTSNSLKNGVSSSRNNLSKTTDPKKDGLQTPMKNSFYDGFSSPFNNDSKQSIHCEGESDSKDSSSMNQTRLKKIPESMLARSCLEASEKLTHLQPTLSHMLFGCGQAASQLACARMNWGSRVQESVISPLHQIAEATATNGELIKSRRQAWRTGGELRSVSERAARAANATNISPSTDPTADNQPTIGIADKRYKQLLPDYGTSAGRRNLCDREGSLPVIAKSPSTPLKISTQPKMSLGTISPRVTTPSPASTISEEDRPSQKVHVCTAKATQLNAIKEELEMESELMKEQALRGLYNFESMSTLECGRALVDLVEISASYHRACASILEEITPLLKGELDDQCPLPVFGRNLEIHLQSSGSRIAYPLRLCIQALCNPSCLSEEGLFRSAGSKTKVDTLKSALNTMRAERIIEQYDPFVVADALRQYLRSLPEPLLMRELFDYWIDASKITDTDRQVIYLQRTAAKMSDACRTNAGYLFRFLHRVSSFADKNRMTAFNLSIVFGPTLLAPDSSQTFLDLEADDGGCLGKEANLNVTSSMCPEVRRKNGTPASLPFSGARGNVIEMLITHAHAVFPLQDDDECEFDYATQTSDEAYESLESPPSAWTGELEEKLNDDEGNKEYKPLLIFSTNNDLCKKTSHAISEFARQSRVIRTIPQRMKVKHTAAWKTICNRPQSSPSEGKMAGASSRHLKPASVRSLTPVSIQREPKDTVTCSSLPDTNKIARDAINVENKFFSLDAKKSPEAWSEEIGSQFVLSKENEALKDCHPPPPPRSDLQRQHQEWRRAMLEVSSTGNGEEREAETKFAHRDFYDTLFTLQTLNSLGGLENFLLRVRSVYENKTSILKPAKPDPVKNIIRTKSPQGIAYIRRRHSTSSLAVAKMNDSSALPKPINPPRHYNKCLTLPGPVKERPAVTVSPLEACRRPAGSIARSRQPEFSQLSMGMTNSRNLPQQGGRTTRSSCAARLGDKLLMDPDYLRITQRSSTPSGIATSLKTRNTLPRTFMNGDIAKLTAPTKPPTLPFEQIKKREYIGNSLPSLQAERMALKQESLPPT